MTEDSDGAGKKRVTPEEIDHTHLPDQRMYKVELDEASSFTQREDAVETYPLFITNDFKLIYFEIAVGECIPWHTHTPHFDEVCMGLTGQAEFTLEQEDGSHQLIQIGPRECVYLPGGAHHKIEATGEQKFESLVAMPSEPVARLEMIEGESPYSMEDWPVALWIDRKRNEIVSKDDDATSA
jgi:quercetin dioxygenase-like cupin family protein